MFCSEKRLAGLFVFCSLHHPFIGELQITSLSVSLGFFLHNAIFVSFLFFEVFSNSRLKGVKKVAGRISYLIEVIFF